MNNVNVVYNQAVQNVWDLLSGAMFNHLYHEDLAAHYDRVAFWLQIATPLLIVLGVISAMLPAQAVEKADERKRRVRWNIIIAFVLAIGAIVAGAMTPDGKLAEHRILSKQWLSVIDELQDIRTKLYAIGPTKDPVSAETLAQISILGHRSTSLQQSELDPVDDEYFQLAKVQARSRLYGEHVKTRQQAIEEFDRRKKLGTIPGRSTAEGNTPSPKKEPGRG